MESQLRTRKGNIVLCPLCAVLFFVTTHLPSGECVTDSSYCVTHVIIVMISIITVPL